MTIELCSCEHGEELPWHVRVIYVNSTLFARLPIPPMSVTHVRVQVSIIYFIDYDLFSVFLGV